VRNSQGGDADTTKKNWGKETPAANGKEKDEGQNKEKASDLEAGTFQCATRFRYVPLHAKTHRREDPEKNETRLGPQEETPYTTSKASKVNPPTPFSEQVDS
jgi:hypothetical protein